MFENKRSVGRPKLADSKLKKKSIIIIFPIILLIMLVVGYITYKRSKEY